MLSPANWTNAFNDRLNSSYPRKFSESAPVLVSLHNPLLQWPIDSDGQAFIASFGRIIRFNEEVRRLAAVVFYSMNEKYQLGMNPALPGIQEGKFYGSHLRTAVDAVKAGWTPYSIQSKNYIMEAVHSNIPLIYLAADSPPELLQFVQAANLSSAIKVTTKDLLLLRKGFAKELDEMSLLTLDQQSLIDYEVLLRASRFGGTWESSFAWNLAMRRHVVAGRGSWEALETDNQAKAKPAPSAPKASKPTTTTSKAQSSRSTVSTHWNTSNSLISTKSTIESTTSPVPVRRSSTHMSGEVDFSNEERGVDRTAEDGQESTQEKRDAFEVESDTSNREPFTDTQSFHDAYSTIFGDVTPDDHPGIVFQLALWP